MKNRILIIVIVILTFCFGYWFFNDKEDVKEKPKNVPENAVWKGGLDGGNWIELVSFDENIFRFRIFRDWDGELILDSNFKFQDCGVLILNESNWKEYVLSYSNENIGIIEVAGISSECRLIPIYPAFGGEEWEIIKEKDSLR